MQAPQTSYLQGHTYDIHHPFVWNALHACSGALSCDVSGEFKGEVFQFVDVSDIVRRRGFLRWWCILTQLGELFLLAVGALLLTVALFAYSLLRWLDALSRCKQQRFNCK